MLCQREQCSLYVCANHREIVGAVENGERNVDLQAVGAVRLHRAALLVPVVLHARLVMMC